MISNNKKETINYSSKIFIAGHNGLIGSAILKKFKNAGYKNVLTKKRSELDLIDNNETFDFFKKERPDVLILAAGYTGGILENKKNPHKLLQENLQIQLNALSSAYNTNVQKAIFFGSSCMYPKYSDQPIKESFLLNGKPDENSLSYALAKLAGLQMCDAYNSLLKKNTFVSLIPNTVYGPNDNFNHNSGHVLSSLIQRFHKAKVLNLENIQLWGSGKAKREFIFSEDLADMCLIAIEGKIINNFSTLNVGSGNEISIEQLSKEIAHIIGYNGKITWDNTKPDGVARKLLCSRRAMSLGWKPKTDFLYGLNKTYKWFLEHKL